MKLRAFRRFCRKKETDVLSNEKGDKIKLNEKVEFATDVLEVWFSGCHSGASVNSLVARK
jgi:hypothetical protein